MLNPILYANNTPLTLTIDPAGFVEDVLSSSGTTTSTLTIVPTGGVGTLTFNWTIVSSSGSGFAFIADSTSATTAIEYGGLSFTGAYVSLNVKGTVTDQAGQTAYTIVPVVISQYGLSGGEIP